MLRSATILALILASVLSGAARSADLSKALVVVKSDDPVVANAARVLAEEVAKRTGLSLFDADSAPASGAAIILSVSGAGVPDGFSVSIDGDRVGITGNDARGVLFGVGHLLRKCDWADGKLSLDASHSISTAPAYAIRGHQMGYRHRANTFDKWTPKQYEQYIRDLAIFGANAIENIPTEGGVESEHMLLTRAEMNTRLSEICQQYGIDYWLWYPATFDLTDAELRGKSLEEHDAVFASCPKLDAVFFPGGDPGDNHPREVLAFLEDVAPILHKYHPGAMIWLSMQGYRGEEVDYVFDYIIKNDPKGWLGGLVHGPGSPSIAETRARLPKHYALRLYPDENHVVRCQFPVPYLDPALARTHTREPVFVMPRFEKFLHDAHAPYTVGFIAYSDGSHDDVNKAVWSRLGWAPETTVKEIVDDYGRYFLSSEHADELGDLLLAFERNWEGALETNGGVAATAAMARQLLEPLPEDIASDGPNWRRQMFLMRALLDNLTRERMIYENTLEERANEAILTIVDKSPEAAMRAAAEILAEAGNPPANIARMQQRITELCEDLWQSIGFQSSVEKYGAAAGHRAAILDYIDVPLNDRWWLEDEFEKVRAMPDEAQKTARLTQLATWESPREGGFYDDLGNIGRSAHVVFPGGSNAHVFEQWIPNPTMWALNGGFSRGRQAWTATLRWPHMLRYTTLDPESSYTLRLVGVGEAKPRAEGQLLEATAYGREEGDIKEFPVPPALSKDGVLEITFDDLDENHLNWRVQSRLAEAWLIRN